MWRFSYIFGRISVTGSTTQGHIKLTEFHYASITFNIAVLCIHAVYSPADPHWAARVSWRINNVGREANYGQIRAINWEIRVCDAALLRTQWRQSFMLMHERMASQDHFSSSRKPFDQLQLELWEWWLSGHDRWFRTTRQVASCVNQSTPLYATKCVFLSKKANRNIATCGNST